MKNKILVMIPSDDPVGAARVYQSFLRTGTGRSDILFYVERGRGTFPGYLPYRLGSGMEYGGAMGELVKAKPDYRLYMLGSQDMCFESTAWDAAILSVFDVCGGAVACSAEGNAPVLSKARAWGLPNVLPILAQDPCWDWARGLEGNNLYYLPEVLISMQDVEDEAGA